MKNDMNFPFDFSDLFETTGRQEKNASTKPLANFHEFYLSGTIQSPEEYVSWFDTIRHSTQNDVIKIYINSPGGDVFTAIQFMKVLNETQATVIMSAEGACISAASMIFLRGKVFEVSPHTMFMFHNYSGGVMGKGGEMLDQLSHERRWSEKLLREVYVDFLSEEEIQSILDNKDIWMDGDEVLKRLENRSKKDQTSNDSEDEGTEE